MTDAERLDIADAAMAAGITAAWQRAGRAVLIGLSGSQGSGKSTTARRIADRLREEGRSVVVRSLDDFYLSRADRQTLAVQVHPLLATRGVPGTHDMALLLATIEALLEGREVALPTFDKTMDDRAPPANWPFHSGSVDVLLLEGWCIGVRAQPEAMLNEPVNTLERIEDSDGRWRRFVNAQITGDYALLNARLDLRLIVRAPDFDCVQAWRAEQERGLDRKPGAHPPMDDAAIARFIAHYERLTRWMLLDEPADLIVDLDTARTPQAVRFTPRG